MGTGRNSLALVLFIILLFVGLFVASYYFIQLVYGDPTLPKPDICGLMDLPTPGIAEGTEPYWCYTF